jgi:carboxypeptidase C (cathepsin A)
VGSLDCADPTDGRQLGERSNSHVSVAGDLSTAMSRSTHLKAQGANGYCGLATPFSAAEFTMHHPGLGSELRDKFRLLCHPAGHVRYVHPPSPRQLKEDIVGFVEWATSRGGG